MNIMKRILSLLLCVAMLAAYLPAAGSAAAAESNVEVTADKKVVNVGEEVKVTLSNKEMTVASIGAGIKFDKRVLECVSIVAGDPESPNDFGLNDTDGAFSDGSCSTVAQANKEGTVGFVVGGSYDLSYEAGTIFVATFKALKKGTVDIVAYEDSANIDDTIYKGNANTWSVTVKGPNVYLAPGETSVTKDESITVTLSYSDLTVYSFNCGIKYDTEMLECVSIEGHNPNNSSKVFLWNGKRYVNPEAVSTIEDAKREGAVGVGKSGTAETTYKAHDLFTVTFKALMTGNTTITVYERSDGPDGWENENVETRTITIKAPCEHFDPDTDGDHICDYCGEPDVSDHITATKEETTPASCDKEGKVETVTFCSDCKKELNRVDKETIPAGHTWGEPGYTWADDYSTCAAARTCAACGTEEKAEAVITSETTGTNCSDHKTTYTATFNVDWAENQTTEVQLPAKHGELRLEFNGHNEWCDEGNIWCAETWKLRAYCTTCYETVWEVERTSAEPVIIQNPTCDEPGKHTHITSFADVELPDGAKWEDLTFGKYDSLPIYDNTWNTETLAFETIANGPGELGHDWQTTVHSYTDNGDGTHNANYLCKRDETHVKATYQFHDFKNGVCVCEAKQNFTATFLVDGEVYTTATYTVGQTIVLPQAPAKDKNGCTVYTFTGWDGYTDGMTMGTEDLTFTAIFTDALEHTFTKKASEKIEKEATCISAATYYVQCDYCDAVNYDQVVEVGGVNPDNHTMVIAYVNLGAEGHKAYYPCCQTEAAAELVAHTYYNGKCVCEAVQTFTVTVTNSYGTADKVILSNTTAVYGEDYVTTITPAVDSGVSYVEFNAILDIANNAYTFDKETNTLTVKGHAVKRDLVLGVTPYICISVNLDGGQVKDEHSDIELVNGAYCEYFRCDYNGKNPIFGYYDFETSFEMAFDANHFIEKAGYKVIGYKDAEGNFYEMDYEFPWIQNINLTLVWECLHEDKTYTDNGDGTHTITCANGCDLGTEFHTFETGECICEAKQTFTVVVKNEYGTADKVTLFNTTAVYGQDYVTKVSASVGSDVDVWGVGYQGVEDWYGNGIFKYDVDTNTLTVFGDYVTGALKIEAVPIIYITTDLAGGQLTEDWQYNWDVVDGKLCYFMEYTEETNYLYGYRDDDDNYIPDASKVFEKDGYELVGYKDAEGTIYKMDHLFDFTKDISVTLVWECQHEKKTYTDNGDGTHTITCANGCDLGTEFHTFVNGECVCEAKQTFTLTVNVLVTDEDVELTVPYGANLLEVLDQAVADKKIPAIGEIIRFNTWEDIVTGYSYVDENGEWIYDLEGLTMPAGDFAIDQDYGVYRGWQESDVGTEYVDPEKGCLEGWNYIEDDFDDVEDGAWYYFQKVTVDDMYYYVRVEGISRVPYPTEAINGVTYAPDQESIDYAASKGETFIDETEGWFIFDEDGKFQSAETGMGTYFGATRYAENGHIAWHPGMVKSGDDYYYFIGDVENGGNIMATGDIYISRNTTTRDFTVSGLYTFGEDGKLCEYDGITAFNGKLRYYDDAQLMIGAGLVKLTVDGETKYIYVRSNGELVVDAEYWVANVNDHTEINVGTAKFDKNGYMIIEVAQVAKTGVYLEEGKWVYYVEGAKQYNAGLVLLPAETKWYDAEGNVVKELNAEAYVYVRSNAQLVTGTYWITNVGQTEMAVGKYDFDEFGLMQSQMNGIYLVEGNLVFYKDNQIAYNAGLIRFTGTSSEGVAYENDWIYVRSNGQLAVGTYWITNTNGEMTAGKYTFDENGKMQVEEGKKGIVQENGKLFYYVDGVKQVGTGLTVYGESYIYVKSNGELAVGDYYVTNSQGLLSQGMYTFGEDGIMIR